MTTPAPVTTPTLPRYLQAAIANVVEAAFACGEWDDLYSDEPYAALYKQSKAAKAALAEAIERYRAESTTTTTAN